MEGERTPSPEAQLEQIGAEVEENWGRVVDYLRQATIEMVPDISEDEQRSLEENFWPVHLARLEQASLRQPDIAEAIITRAEELRQQTMTAERQALSTTAIKRFFKKLF